LSRHTRERPAPLPTAELTPPRRDHAARRKAAGHNDHRRWNTAADCEINDDLHAEGLPLPGNPPQPATFGFESGKSAEIYYSQLPHPQREAPSNTSHSSTADCGSGAHGGRRFWEVPADDGKD